MSPIEHDGQHSRPVSQLTGVPGQPAWFTRVKDRRPRVGHARARKVPAQLVEDEEYQLRYERVAGIDVAKAKADVCTRLPPARDGGRRASRLEEVPATARDILALAGRLLADGVELAVMEATSDYWRIWYYLLGAPRGAAYSCGDERAPPPGRRSGLVKLEAA